MAWIAAVRNGTIYVFQEKPTKTDKGLFYNDILEGMTPISYEACKLILGKILTFADQPIEITERPQEG